jgi:hypothetical protein
MCIFKLHNVEMIRISKMLQNSFFIKHIHNCVNWKSFSLTSNLASR